MAESIIHLANKEDVSSPLSGPAQSPLVLLCSGTSVRHALGRHSCPDPSPPLVNSFPSPTSLMQGALSSRLVCEISSRLLRHFTHSLEIQSVNMESRLLWKTEPKSSHSVASGSSTWAKTPLPTCTTHSDRTRGSSYPCSWERFLALKCVIFYYFIQHNVLGWKL